MNQFFGIGRLGRDPEVRYFDNGNSVATFSLAIDRGPNKDGDKQPPVWVPCKAWGKQSQLVADLLHKGTKVAVSGRLDLEEWTTRDGEKRSKLIVSVFRFELCESRQQPAHDEDPPF
jgi:single-strand DNA-binding protein